MDYLIECQMKKLFRDCNSIPFVILVDHFALNHFDLNHFAMSHFSLKCFTLDRFAFELKIECIISYFSFFNTFNIMFNKIAIDELNDNCKYRDYEVNEPYWHHYKWTTSDVDFYRKQNRPYCMTDTYCDGYQKILCDSCESILEKYNILAQGSAHCVIDGNFTITQLIDRIDKMAEQIQKLTEAVEKLQQNNY